MAASKDTKLVYSTGAGDLRKAPTAVKSSAKAAVDQKVRVTLDTKNRRGKAVTMISGIQHNPQVIEDLAKTLKNHCGAGGTVEGKNVLIQGDHRDKVIAKLRALGYQL